MNITSSHPMGRPITLPARTSSPAPQAAPVSVDGFQAASAPLQTYSRPAGPRKGDLLALGVAGLAGLALGAAGAFSGQHAGLVGALAATAVAAGGGVVAGQVLARTLDSSARTGASLGFGALTAGAVVAGSVAGYVTGSAVVGTAMVGLGGALAMRLAQA